MASGTAFATSERLVHGEVDELAFGDASAWPGQTIVKALMVLAALPLVGWARSRLPKHARR